MAFLFRLFNLTFNLAPTNWIDQGKRIPRSIVTQVRHKIGAESLNSIPLYYTLDLDQLMNGWFDWQIERFLLDYPYLEYRAFLALNESLKKRKKYDVKNLTEESFPESFIDNGLVCLYGFDVDNRQVMIIRANNFLGVTSEHDWSSTFKKYFWYWTEIADARNYGKGITVVIDAKNLSMGQFHFAMLSFLVKLQKYFPKLFHLVVVHKLRSIRGQDTEKIVKEILKNGKSLVKLTFSRFELAKYVSLKMLPNFMGGTNTQTYPLFPYFPFLGP